MIKNVEFKTPNNEVLQETNLARLYDDMSEKIVKESEDFECRDSGWTLDEILRLEVRTNRYSPFRGSSSFIEVPKQIAETKAIINVINKKDSQCFMWSILAALYPNTSNPNKTSSYVPHLNKLNFDGISFPTPLNEDILNLSDGSDVGYILEVDLEYPSDLHDKHSDFPLAPENKPPPNCIEPRLLTTLEPKTKYVLHYSNLKLYLKLGSKIQANAGEKQLNSSVGTKQLNSTGENNSTGQHERNNSTGENNSTQQQERTTQLGSRNEQLNSAAGMKQLNSPVGTKQLNSSVGTKQLNSALPSTVCNRLHRLHRLYSKIGFFYLLTDLRVPQGLSRGPRSCQVIYSQFGLAIHQKDHQARRRFVEWAQNEIAIVPDFHKRILFSDEAHFWLNGYVNKQNCRIWSEANPQVYVETPLHPEKLTVWCAFWAGGILLQKR
ncbi:uncharacterized protein TNCV_4389741 [Trichonephila clavipes]|nr:uncharacterized protein TNCV_4389741 [Trichonephila clavipes]